MNASNQIPGAAFRFCRRYCDHVCTVIFGIIIKSSFALLQKIIFLSWKLNKNFINKNVQSFISASFVGETLNFLLKDWWFDGCATYPVGKTSFIACSYALTRGSYSNCCGSVCFCKRYQWNLYPSCQ